MRGVILSNIGKPATLPRARRIRHRVASPAHVRWTRNTNEDRDLGGEEVPVGHLSDLDRKYYLTNKLSVCFIRELRTQLQQTPYEEHSLLSLSSFN